MAKTSTNVTAARRREVRRNVVRPTPRWWDWTRRPEIGWATLWASVLTLLGGLIAWSGRETLPYYPGEVATEAIYPRVDFYAVDEAATLRRRENAREKEPSVYRLNTEYFNRIRDHLDEIIRYAADPNVVSVEQLPAKRVEAFRITPQVLATLRAFIENGEPTADWRRLVDQLIENVGSIALLSESDFTKEYDERNLEKIWVQSGDRLVSFYRNVWVNIGGDLQPFRDRVRQAVTRFPAALRETVAAAVMFELQPTLVYDKALSQQQQDKAWADERNVVVGRYRRDGEPIVKAGDRITQEDIDLLRIEQDVYRGAMPYLNPTPEQLEQHRQQRAAVLLRHGARIFGIFAMMGLLAGGLWKYALAYNRRLAENPMRGLALTALLLVGQAMAVGLTQLNGKYVFFTATLPSVMTGMVLAIAYDRRLALGLAAMHALIVIASLELTVGFGIVLLLGVGVSVTLLDAVRSRSKLLEVGAWTALGMGAATLITGMAGRPLHVGGEWTRLAFDAAMAGASGVATGLLVQGILPLIEKAFRVTTAMTLRELNDASHPLLLQLAQEAPGTYQHSLRIADMAEAAAEAIGANALLCKVGALYHDIGKVNKPMYFIENQGGGPNRHNKLSPAMSLLIIVGHVKDGIEMAREYGLPQDIRHFIESHHGTTLVEYFYHAARRQKEAEAEPAPNEFEFRYPGPKPATKEAAILLLADSVEAAVRAMPEPTPVRIEQRVREMANKRLMDGQFDEANITLAELSRIEQAIVKVLCAIYHGRIQYPEERKREGQSRPGEPGADLPRPRLAETAPAPATPPAETGAA